MTRSAPFAFKVVTFYAALYVILLERIAMQRREYAPVEITPSWDDAWFSSDMYEVEMYGHRFIPAQAY